MRGLVGLMKAEFPTRAVTLCDGGFIVFDGDTYTSADAVFGTIGSLQAMTEGAGDEVPALELSLLIPEASAPGDVTQPGFQRARVRMWIGEFDVETGMIVGDPDLLFDGQVDQTTFKTGATRELAMTVVSTAERLFEKNLGNDLSDGFHQSVWPGELGESNATGQAVAVAWGAESPPRAGGGSGAAAGGSLSALAGKYGAP